MRAPVFAAALSSVFFCSAASPALQDSGEVRGSVHVTSLKVGSEFSGFDSVLVYLEGAPMVAEKMPRGPFQMTQSGKAFHPDVLVVPKGSSVAFPNRDEFVHNVFSQASGNSFDLGHYRSGTSKSVTFDAPGVVRVFCNIHPQMAATIIVVDNPFFTHPDSDGTFSIPSVPPGRYRLVAWFPLGGSETHDVEVRAGQSAVVNAHLKERRAANQHTNKHGKPYGGYTREQ